MALRHVTQSNYNGCFVAALAMILGKTYEEAYKLLFPEGDILSGEHAFRSDDSNIGAAAARVLERLGCKVKKSTYRQMKSLIKHARKNTLIIIRWGGGSICHAVVFDAATKQFLDPSGPVMPYDLKCYQRNLDSMYYVERQAA